MIQTLLPLDVSVGTNSMRGPASDFRPTISCPSIVSYMEMCKPVADVEIVMLATSLIGSRSLSGSSPQGKETVSIAAVPSARLVSRKYLIAMTSMWCCRVGFSTVDSRCHPAPAGLLLALGLALLEDSKQESNECNQQPNDWNCLLDVGATSHLLQIGYPAFTKSFTRCIAVRPTPCPCFA